MCYNFGFGLKDIYATPPQIETFDGKCNTSPCVGASEPCPMPRAGASMRDHKGEDHGATQENPAC